MQESFFCERWGRDSSWPQRWAGEGIGRSEEQQSTKIEKPWSKIWALNLFENGGKEFNITNCGEQEGTFERVIKLIKEWSQVEEDPYQ